MVRSLGPGATWGDCPLSPLPAVAFSGSGLQRAAPSAAPQALVQALHSVGSPKGPGGLGGSRTAAWTDFTQALPSALCPQAEGVQLQTRAHDQTGRWPEPGLAPDGAHVSYGAQPVGAAEERGSLLEPPSPLPLSQAEPVLPGPAGPGPAPASAAAARGAAPAQVAASSAPGWGAGRE